MDKGLDIKKYPKSKNNLQCLGPCYHPNTLVIHPTLLEFMTDKEKPFCPVSEWEVTDDLTGKKKKVYSDVCFNPTDRTNIMNKELELNILSPYIDFNAEQFLKIYYEIFSFEDTLDWLDRNNGLPLDTQIRVVDCSLKSFGRNIVLVDTRFVDFIIFIIRKRYINRILAKNRKYIGSNEKSEFMIMESDQNGDDSLVEKTNYLIKVFINRDEIGKFLTRYFKLHNDGWDNHNEFIEPMMKNLSEYISSKILMTLRRVTE